ncbi:hypothetical protein [Miltoncostaea oceani]|uniref:hypothetical protein n=1 Tax=Miltoncostaea oceani TaxID=2843216 RepID=UPI001C3C3FAC|nr:hypothetical protein [Miltoncostaea oceani]
MSVTPGTRIGSYIVEAPLSSGGSVERWTASGGGGDRSVVLMVVRLPEDPVEREQTRETLRRVAAVEHPGLLPVYEAGESGDDAWAAVRATGGRTLADGRDVSREAAARIPATLRSAVDALAAAGLAPSAVAPADVLVDGERAYLIPADHLAGDDTGPAHADIDRLPIPTRPGRRRPLLIAAVVAAVVLIGVAVFAFSQSAGDEAPAPSPTASVAGRIPLGISEPGAIAVDDTSVWVASERGIVRVDVATQTPIGAPLSLEPVLGPDAMIAHDGSLYLAREADVVRVAPETGRILARRPLQGAIGLVVSGDSLFVSVQRGAAAGRVVELAADDLTPIRSTEISGANPLSIEATDGGVWAVNQASGTAELVTDEGVAPVYVGAEPVGGAASAEVMWVASPRDGLVMSLSDDPTIDRVVHIDGAPVFLSPAQDGEVWIWDPAALRLTRIDAGGGFVGTPLDIDQTAGDVIPGPIVSGPDSVWLVLGGDLLRVRPAQDDPGVGEGPALAPGDLVAGPTRDNGSRVRASGFALPVSLVVPSAGWFHELPGQADAISLRWSALPTEREAVVAIDTPTRLFDGRGGVRRVRTVDEALEAIQQNPVLRAGPATPVSLAGTEGVTLDVSALPSERFVPLCGAPCAPFYPLADATVIVEPRTPLRVTLLEGGDGRVILVSRPAGRFGADFQRESAQIIESLQLEGQ